LKERFPERYPSSGDPAFYRAPGRVNLIGEHTDYNLGFVMPIAIDMACYAAVAPSSSPAQLRLYSEDLLQGCELPADQISSAKPRAAWSDYVIGIAQQLAAFGVNVKPADLLIHSTVPVGAGLSSSAALEVSSALALSGSSIADKLELAKLCRRAENEFVGMPCGIMDQFISIFGKAHCAIKLDCRSLEYEEVPLPANVTIIAVNSMVKHELGTSAYRQRVAECGEAVRTIKRSYPEVASLRDVTQPMLSEVQGIPHRRARHIVTENDRVNAFAAAARTGDREAMGRAFVDSHLSMRDDYEVSCPEIDYLVDTSIKLPGVFGARMTGGGFGGCTVNLVDPPAAAEFRERIVAAYKQRFGIEAQLFDCVPSDGAGPVFL
jgi:galactokinase